MSRVSQPHDQVGQPYALPFSLRLRVSVLHRHKDCIYAVVQCRFDPRAPVHPKGLYNQTPDPRVLDVTDRREKKN